MNINTANDNELRGDDQIVAEAGGFSLTRGELLFAFNRLVGDRENWKDPIDAFLPAVTSEREIAAVAEAVVFFAGCVARIDRLPLGGYRVRAAGYYRSVGPNMERIDYAMVGAEFHGAGTHRGSYRIDFETMTATPQQRSTPAGVLAHPIPAVRVGDELVLNADQIIDPATGKWIVRPAGRRLRIVDEAGR